MHKQRAKPKMKTKRGKERSSTQPWCHSRLTLLITTFCHCSTPIHYVLLLFVTANNCHSTMTIEIKWTFYASVCFSTKIHTPHTSNSAPISKSFSVTQTHSEKNGETPSAIVFAFDSQLIKCVFLVFFLAKVHIIVRFLFFGFRLPENNGDDCANCYFVERMWIPSN